MTNISLSKYLSTKPLANGDIDAIGNIAEAYPYFSVAALLSANDTESLSKKLHYFNINPVLFQIYLNKINGNLNKTVKDEIVTYENNRDIDTIIEPISAQDYFATSQINISDEMPSSADLADMHSTSESTTDSSDKALLIQMKFEEWLLHITAKKRKEKEDLEEQEALKLKWKQQKLADAIQEENDDIPEEVFKMAVDSIEREESLVSESLANIYATQGKKAQAISMYKKLILQNPQKKAYFADKIQQLNKDIQ